LLVLVVSDLRAEPPAYPGQPHINSALKHLKAAKAKAADDAPGALASLESAGGTLAGGIHNKGTYQTIARQLIDQAKRHLEKGEVEAAVHKIDEALENVNRAGQTGEH